jgi:hypothetical protein
MIRKYGRPMPLEPADAILAVGAGLWPSGPSLSIRVSIARVLNVCREGWAPQILCSGGRSRGSSEADAMRAPLVEAGVSAGAIIPDDVSAEAPIEQEFFFRKPGRMHQVPQAGRQAVGPEPKGFPSGREKALGNGPAGG